VTGWDGKGWEEMGLRFPSELPEAFACFRLMQAQSRNYRVCCLAEPSLAGLPAVRRCTMLPCLIVTAQRIRGERSSARGSHTHGQARTRTVARMRARARPRTGPRSCTRTRTRTHSIFEVGVPWTARMSSCRRLHNCRVGKLGCPRAMTHIVMPAGTSFGWPAHAS